jgi:hypothetical protein
MVVLHVFVVPIPKRIVSGTPGLLLVLRFFSLILLIARSVPSYGLWAGIAGAVSMKNKSLQCNDLREVAGRLEPVNRPLAVNRSGGKA